MGTKTVQLLGTSLDECWTGCDKVQQEYRPDCNLGCQLMREEIYTQETSAKTAQQESELPNQEKNEVKFDDGNDMSNVVNFFLDQKEDTKADDEASKEKIKESNAKESKDLVPATEDKIADETKTKKKEEEKANINQENNDSKEINTSK